MLVVEVLIYRWKFEEKPDFNTAVVDLVFVFLIQVLSGGHFISVQAKPKHLEHFPLDIVRKSFPGNIAGTDQGNRLTAS